MRVGFPTAIITYSLVTQHRYRFSLFPPAHMNMKPFSTFSMGKVRHPDDALDLQQGSNELLKDADYHTPEEADALVALDMTNLSHKERDQVLHDVHGVSDETKETPELIDQSLAQLETELESLPEKQAFELARTQNSSYVDSPGFRLKFLRTDLFDVPSAAKRLALYFQENLELFGPDKLVKDIIQDDLEDGDIKNLYSGYVQTLPLRDRAGRIVAFLMPPPKPTFQKKALECNGQSLIHKVCFSSFGVGRLQLGLIHLGACNTN
jgi:hypothetical protein